MRSSFSKLNRRHTKWGLFHNLDEPTEEVAYVTLHAFGFQARLTWEKRSD